MESVEIDCRKVVGSYRFRLTLEALTGIPRESMGFDGIPLKLPWGIAEENRRPFCLISVINELLFFILVLSKFVRANFKSAIALFRARHGA